MSKSLRKITVVPHYMRLQEWIAEAEGYWAGEGLAPVFKTDMMIDALVNPNADHGRGEQPDYQEGEACTSSACEWGVIRNAGAGHGKVLTEVYSVAPYAIFVKPSAPYHSLTDLRDKPVGAMLRSGTHFTALKALEACMPRERVNVVGTGGAGRRIQALADGQVEAVCLLDPERGIAEQSGLRCLARGEFRVLFYVSDDMAPDLVAPYLRVLARADASLRATPAKYMHLWEKNMRPETHGRYDTAKFGRGELLFFEAYPRETFEEGMAYAKGWGLTGDVVNENYDELTARILQ